MVKDNLVIRGPADLETIRERDRAERARLGQDLQERLLVCVGGGCLSSGSQAVKTALEDALDRHGLRARVGVLGVGCLGPCVRGPVVVLEREGTFYQGVAPADAEEIVREHLAGGRPVERLFWKEGEEERPVGRMADLAFFRKQVKIVLRNCGRIAPTDLDQYIGQDGYFGLARALAESPEAVIEQMKISGLRGRGGAGFPTHLKWSLARKVPGSPKYLICNADEGDPGAFMDRSVLEGDPFSVIEGMTIAAYAIGASRGFVYVRAEYPLAVERVQQALATARQRGLLGERLLGSPFSFDIEVRMGSGAFVCGEETALIASIEGRRGEPRPRPPFPVQRGLWDQPTVINNVETLANVPFIALQGGAALARHGTERSKGTKVFALAGAIANAGLVEVPIGLSLGELVYDVGGGIRGGKTFKAAQMGGPSGGCIPREHLSVALDYESLQELGAIMGSGGMIVMDEDTCMVDVARFFLEFVQEESCGKCVPCRVGTKRMLEMLERICAGQGQPGDLQRLIDLGRQIKDTSLCGLGQTAPNPALSTLRHFREEYEQHVYHKTCPAGTCAGLVRAPCQSACPAHVDVPGFVALTGDKRYAEALRLHRERNPFAAVCARVCFHSCEEKCRRASVDEPVSIRGIKRFMVDQEIVAQVPEVWENPANAARRVAIVGGGPAGLSCAYFLARLGYRPVVLEAEPRPGGMLVQTIPAYRLPRETLAREIRMIERLGVEIRTGQRLGHDFTLGGLRQEGYEAVFLGIGTPGGIHLHLPGAHVEGVRDALGFLREYNLRGSVKVGRQVVVVGGGNCATDAARTALRLGAEVVMVYRRTQAEMPAYAEEIEESLAEGVIIKTLTHPTEILLHPDGRIRAVRCQRMTLGAFDRTGRRRPEESPELFELEADQVLFAIGQQFDYRTLSDGLPLQLTEDGRAIKTDPLSGATSVPWLFCGGDAATGPLSVIHAVSGGERAAVGIDRLLTGAEHAYWREEREWTVSYDPESDPLPYPRGRLPTMAVERRRYNFDEVEAAWTEGEALRQAHRCLRCDYGKKC